MEQNTIWRGIIRNVKYGTTKTGERAVKFQIGEPFYMQVGGKEPVLCATWNNVCAKVTEKIPTNLKDGDKVQVSGKLHAINDDLSLDGTFLFANKIITESKTSKNMKNTVKLNESQLRKIVAESVKKMLSELDMGDGYFSLPGEGVEDDRTLYEKCRDELDRACQYASMAEDAYKEKNIEEFHNRFQDVWSCCCKAFEYLGYDEPNW